MKIVILEGTSKIKFKALLRHFVTARHSLIDQDPEQMHYFLPPYRYISGDELSALIKSNAEPHKDYVVVDVRDDDYIGGNIKGAVNCPSFSFEDDVDKLVEKTKDVKTVVFHCALSQQRGPKAARIYAEARRNTLKEDEEPKHEVLVLRGGFTEFQLKYKNDAELIENWDKNVWNNPYF